MYIQFKKNAVIMYLMFIYISGIVISNTAPDMFRYLTFDLSKIISGEVWRLVTFLIPYYPVREFIDFLFIFINFIFYMSIGMTLESVIGRKDFVGFILVSIIIHLITAIILGIIFSMNYSSFVLIDIYISLTILYGLIFQNEYVILYFFPVKFIWLVYIYVAKTLYIVFSNGIIRSLPEIITIILPFVMHKLYVKSTISRKEQIINILREEIRKKTEYDENKVVELKKEYHRCSKCNKTDITNPDEMFRYCSKCTNPKEFCEVCLKEHEHD